MKESDFFRVCADVDLSAVRTNIINIQKRLKPSVKTCCVIKADGYGHGAVPVARAVDDLADFFAVAAITEALNLRAHGVEKPVLILGYIHPDGYEAAIEGNIRTTVFDFEAAQAVSKAAVRVKKTAKIHIKIDTGMSRIGFYPCPESAEIIKKISRLPGIEIEGIFTHLFAADAAGKESALAQIGIFNDFCALLEENSLSIPIKHCSNSAAAISIKQANLDMVRLGIAQYGLYPSEDVHELCLVPALSLKSHVVMVKTIKAGTTVGYGATYTAAKDIRVATIPVGYADGYFRTLSNRGYVLAGGKRAPIIGRVCMDQFMVDVSRIEGVVQGSEVVLIGSMGDETITMEEISALAGSFNYEFACDIGKRVPRRYFLDGKFTGSKDYFMDKY